MAQKRQINVRLDEADYGLLKRRSEEEGCNESDLIRRLLREGKSGKELLALVLDKRLVGQIRKLLLGSGLSFEDHIQDLLEQKHGDAIIGFIKMREPIQATVVNLKGRALKWPYDTPSSPDIIYEDEAGFMSVCCHDRVYRHKNHEYGIVWECLRDTCYKQYRTSLPAHKEYDERLECKKCIELGPDRLPV